MMPQNSTRVYSAPKGVTIPNLIKAIEPEPINKWVLGRKRGRRIRYIMAVLIYYDMKAGVEYTIQGLCDMCHKYNPTGANAMSLTRQRVASLLVQLSKLGAISIRQEGGKNYYYKVKK